MLKIVLSLVAVLLIAFSCQPSVSAHHSSDWLYRIMMCESGGDPLAENLSDTESHWDGRTGSFGLFQFSQGTWNDIAIRAFDGGLIDVDWSHSLPHYAPEEVQWDMARFVWDGGAGWHHWWNCAISAGYPDAM